MCTADTLHTITERVVQGYKTSFGDKLRQVYLYGSYARGDYDAESDIDFVAIVDADYGTLNQIMHGMSEITSDLGLAHDILISAGAIPADNFEKYREALPYYRNILAEGVKLIA